MKVKVHMNLCIYCPPLLVVGRSPVFLRQCRWILKTKINIYDTFKVEAGF